MAELRYEHENQGALHHQCIDELTSHIRVAPQHVVEVTTKSEAEKKRPDSPVRSTTPTSFVTVIEVKDSSPVCSSPTPPVSVSTLTSQGQSGEVGIIGSPCHSIDDSSISETLSRSDESVISTVQNVEVKRKIPPRYVEGVMCFEIISIIILLYFHSNRPPPKMARRVGPLADSPISIMETPPSPLNTGNAQTATSPSSNTINSAGTTSTPLNKSESMSSGSSDSNVKPSEFLRHKNDEKLLLKFSHGNIAKSGSNSSSESLINSANNEENLNIESFPISERVSSNQPV